MLKTEVNINFQNKILIFFKKNLKTFIFLISIIFIILFSFLFYKNLQEKNNIKISEKYTQATILLNKKKIDKSRLLLESIINEKHKFYSPLALYLLIDQSLIKDSVTIIALFDKILKIKNIEKEDLNLIKIKKAIYLFNTGNEELIIKSLNTVINSDSIWRNMSIKLISEYFLSKNQKIKADEYIKLLSQKKNK
jgi:predicted negative regulator of RcsB-dependent stress response|tara:strand:+ start:58 stop:639 length:582 start_codon:yes stop_codon:yes gene_type:complete